MWPNTGHRKLQVINVFSERGTNPASRPALFCIMWLTCVCVRARVIVCVLSTAGWQAVKRKSSSYTSQISRNCVRVRDFVLFVTKNKWFLLYAACNHLLCCRDQSSTWHFCLSYECVDILMLRYYNLWFAGENILFTGLSQCWKMAWGRTLKMWRCVSLSVQISHRNLLSFLSKVWS